MKKVSSKFSVSARIWLLASVIFAAMLGFGAYTLISTNDQIREDFFRRASGEVQSVCGELGLPMWLHQNQRRDVIIQGLENRPHISFIYLASPAGERLYGFRDETFAERIRRFERRNIPRRETADQLLVRQEIAYEEEPLGYLMVGFSSQAMNQRIAAKEKEMMLAAGILAVFTILLTLLISRSLTRPIKAVSKALKTYEPEEKGFTLRLAERGGREMTRLARYFNRQAEQVDRQLRETRQAQHNIAALHKKLYQRAKALQKTNDDTRREVKRLSGLLELQGKMLRCRSAGEVLEVLVGEGRNFMAAREAVVYWHDPKTKRLAPVRSFREDLMPTLEAIGNQSGSLGRVYADNRCLFGEYFSPADWKVLGLSPEGAPALIALPISDRESRYGVMVFWRTSGQFFNEEDTRMGLALVNSAALAFEKIQLLQALKDKSSASISDPSAFRESQWQLLQLQKMESLEILVGGMVHDFNNILGIINPNLDLLRMKYRGHKEIETRLAAIQEASDRAARLTAQLLTFVRSEALQLTPLAVNELIVRVVPMLQRALGEEIRVQTDLDPAVAQVQADESKLCQILVNLSVNARDAMPQGGTLTLRTALTTYAPVSGGAVQPPRPFVAITVADSGVGIAEKHLYRIFDPFFTTQSSPKTAGLGLAVVYGIVKSHHGHISVESEEGRGTAFHIYLEPHHVSPQGNGPLQKDGQPLSKSGSENILIVDDEQRIRESLSELLTFLGYTVYEAEGGQNALEILQSHRDIDAAIVDFSMPHMNGIETIKAMREIDSTIKIVLSSGYVDQEKVALAQSNIQAFLPKPYHLESLSDTIKSVLGES